MSPVPWADARPQPSPAPHPGTPPWPEPIKLPGSSPCWVRPRRTGPAGSSSSGQCGHTEGRTRLPTLSTGVPDTQRGRSRHTPRRRPRTGRAGHQGEQCARPGDRRPARPRLGSTARGGSPGVATARAGSGRAGAAGGKTRFQVDTGSTMEQGSRRGRDAQEERHRGCRGAAAGPGRRRAGLGDLAGCVHEWHAEQGRQDWGPQRPQPGRTQDVSVRHRAGTHEDTVQRPRQQEATDTESLPAFW